MSVQRLVRAGVAGVFVMLCTAAQAASMTVIAQANTVAGEPAVARPETRTAAHEQTTALISARLREVIRPEANELARTPFVATRAPGAGAVPLVQDAPARVDEEAADMAELEIYALIAATLIAVLSLSRRRNL